MKMSSEINELAKALARVQAKMKPAEFDSVNPFYKSKYASLGSVIEAYKAAAEGEGIAISQPPISDGWYAGINNIVMHESGQWFSQEFLMPLDPDSKNPIQEAGKAISYARRYGLASLFGIYSDEDIDANTTSQQTHNNTYQQPPKTAQKPSKSPQKKASDRPYTPEQVKIRLHEIAETMSPASDAQLQLLASSIGKVLTNTDIRHDAQEYLFGARSLKDVDRKLINAGLKWINLDDDYNVDKLAETELKSIQSAFLLSKGQQKMDDLLNQKSI